MIQKTSKEFEIVETQEKAKYIINGKDTKVFLYDEKIVKNVIDKKFNEKYKSVLSIINNINDSDDANESDIVLVQDKIDDLKLLLINKYSKYLDKRTIDKYLRMIYLLGEKLFIPKKGKSR